MWLEREAFDSHCQTYHTVQTPPVQPALGNIQTRPGLPAVTPPRPPYLPNRNQATGGARINALSSCS